MLDWVISVKYSGGSLVAVAGNAEPEQAKAQEWNSDANFVSGGVCKLGFVNVSPACCC